MNDIQQQVQEAIDRLVESGAERGLQVAVYLNGALVVDAIAGVADPATGRPITSDTPFYCYSVGKGATATVAHVLVERGLFGYDTPAARSLRRGVQRRRSDHGLPFTWALGYSIGRPGTEAQETQTVFGMGGVGGSHAYADTATGTAFALTKNRLTPSFDAAVRVAEIVTEGVGGDGDDSRARSDEPESDLPTGLAKPARRALAAAGYVRLEQLTEVSEVEIMELHGMGPSAMERLRSALAARGQGFAGS